MQTGWKTDSNITPRHNNWPSPSASERMTLINVIIINVIGSSVVSVIDSDHRPHTPPRLSTPYIYAYT